MLDAVGRLVRCTTGLVASAGLLIGCTNGDEPNSSPSGSLTEARSSTPTSSPSAAASTGSDPLTRNPIATSLIESSAIPIDFAIGTTGDVLAIYKIKARHAWRLFSARDRILAEGLGGAWVEPAGDGFVLGLQSGRLAYVNSSKGVSAVQVSGRRLPVQRRDVYVMGAGVFRPDDLLIFNGRAEPNGVVSAMDPRGRMWAIGAGRRTVVRYARPGTAWKTITLGPSVGADDIVARGKIILVVGSPDLFASTDAGATWLRASHSVHVDRDPMSMTIYPDGSAGGMNFYDGFRYSKNLRTFLGISPDDAPPLIGGLFSRLRDGRLELSVNQRLWSPFSSATVRRLIDYP